MKRTTSRDTSTAVRGGASTVRVSVGASLDPIVDAIVVLSAPLAPKV